jgi:hypothetical protein
MWKAIKKTVGAALDNCGKCSTIILKRDFRMSQRWTSVGPPLELALIDVWVQHRYMQHLGRDLKAAKDEYAELLIMQKAIQLDNELRDEFKQQFGNQPSTFEVV